MTAILRLFSGLRQRFYRLPILDRVLLGNSIVIVVGAVGGTLLTRHLTAVAGALWLILSFSFLGILLSLVVNYWIVRTALRPLHELRESVGRVQCGRANLHAPLTTDADPNIRQLATAIDSMLDRLDRRALQLRALSERAIDAQEEERKRIARGLHDDTCQALSTLIINLGRLEASLPAELPDVHRRLQAVCQLATRTLDDLRKVVYGLRPTMLDDLGLAPAIRWYARSSLEEAGIQVKFDALDETTRLPPQVETALFRVAQEAINNVVHHANAKLVILCLFRDDGHLCLRVEDDGRGFDITQINSQALGLRRLGLLGIQERAELIGGDVTVDSAPGRGTRLQMRVPFLGVEGDRIG